MLIEQARPTATYTCPMHPEVQQDRPGTCPKCGMQLVPRQQQEGDGKHGLAPVAGDDSMRAHHEMMRQLHEGMLWTNFTNIGLGTWLMTSPAMFSYGSAGLVWSDLVSGTLLVLFATLSLSLRLDLARWGVCLVGIWLLFAPLVFWAPTAVVYTNDTLVGALVIAFSVLVPMMPGKAHHMAMMLPGPEIPPGWSYNPSTWWQRGPIIALAFVGFFISRYLAAYQLGHIPAVWDPFFGDGTKRILESEVSRAWPISDAGLGAVAYMLEALSGYMGGVTRWRSMPWMVAMFGFLVVPLGIVSIVLIILQPLAVGAWCTLCLIAAVAMLIMISPALDEVIAMIQFLIQSRRQGKPFWRTLWVGGTLENAEEVRPPHRSAGAEFLSAMNWETVPWNLVVSTGLGVGIMCAPSVWGTQGAAADSDHLVGALIVTFAVIAIGEVARAARFVNVLFGAWLVGTPWLLTGFTPGAQWTDVVVGAVLILLSLPRGHVKERYGSWQRYIV
ncbi:MAG: vitamin K epoxide reductase family protein [Gemmataceae bacterium]|nr:vitamin K epoxide reductase family protein [Gemmataceae bacterium]